MRPDELLFRDLDGVLVGLDEVVFDGFERSYADRVPALRALLVDGEPEHRLLACLILVAWGVRDGFLAAIDWARDLNAVPWAGSPVTFDRLFGVDDAFARICDALRWGQDAPLSPAGALLRTATARSVLPAADRVYLDRSMAQLLYDDATLARACEPELRSAVEATVAAAPAAPALLGFDLATQAASLVGPLAVLDDAGAAAAALRLLDATPGGVRAGKELAYSLGAGRGPATDAVLRTLAGSGIPDVRAEALLWLDRRDRA